MEFVKRSRAPQGAAFSLSFGGTRGFVFFFLSFSNVDRNASWQRNRYLGY